MKEILVVDDDIQIGNVMEKVLSEEGYAVSRAYSGTEVLLFLKGHRPDLILSGSDAARVFRGGNPAGDPGYSCDCDQCENRDGQQGKASSGRRGGLYDEAFFCDGTSGAGGCTAPARGKPVPAAGLLRFQEIELDTGKRSVKVGGVSVKLTKTEYAVLKLLMRNPSQVMTRSVLLDEISGDSPDGVESSLKVHVSNLRRKLREAGGKDYIESVLGNRI